MSVSQNGWPVFTAPPPATTPHITGRVRPGDVDLVLTWLGDQFNNRVEHIIQEWSWGWAPRPVRGSVATTSNHASGTAVDFNAPAHVLGKRGTFSQRQNIAIRAILRELEGVVRWGGDYVNRADEMHFEIIANAAAVHRVAEKIRNGTIGGAKPWSWNPDVISDLNKVQEQFQIAQGTREGNVQRFHGVARIQWALGVTIDGYVGPKTVAAWRQFEETLPASRKSGRAGTPDPLSLRARGIGKWFKGPEAVA